MLLATGLSAGYIRQAPGPAWVTPVIVIATLAVVLGLLQVQVAVLRRRLPSLRAAEGADWVGLCRLRGGQYFINPRPLRKGWGPQGTLMVTGLTLAWRPAPEWYGRRGPFPAFQWTSADVVCLRPHYPGSVDGIQMSMMDVRVPQGEVSFGVIADDGVLPPALRFGTQNS